MALPRKPKIVAYFRVSTERQGRSGLGLEAQRSAVQAYADSIGAKVSESFTEVESGKRSDRPELAKALRLAKVTNAVLVIAKLDRLSRDAAFLLTLQNNGVRFLAADMPQANELTVGIMALVAQQERQAISKRTKEALAAAKARGTRLGNPNGAAPLRRAGKGNQAAIEAKQAKARELAEDLRPILEELSGQSLREVAGELNARGIASARGGEWHAASVDRVLRRLKAART